MALATTGRAVAQKPGGILKLYNIDSPASMSIYEEATVFSQMPMMAVFNNLVMFDQYVKQNSLRVIVPDLAISRFSGPSTTLTAEVFPTRIRGAANGVAWAIAYFVGFALWPFVTVALQQATGSFALAFLCIPAFMTAMAIGVWLSVPEQAGKGSTPSLCEIELAAKSSRKKGDA